jgi:hypothetical protein
LPSPEWPDWSGQTAAVIASGPSLKRSDVELLRGRARVLAIKKNSELAPWADAVYGCDYPWWRSVRGLPDFKGLRMAYAPRACKEFGCRPVLIPNHASSDALRFEEVGSVGGGGNSGFQALNLAVQFGATRILLLGFDCQDKGGAAHWYGRNSWANGSNPSESNFKRWRKAFAKAAEQLNDRGVEVINASPASEIKGFRKAAVAEALEQWSVCELA